MDEIVKAAMAKWPNVPDCYGWLGLDARGRWWMRDERAQHAGPFAGPGASATSRGSELKHAKLLAFIHRNYARDERGCWYFQNGPQRVFVELECAPWVWRLTDDGRLTSHTGIAEAAPPEVHTDESGHLYAKGQSGWGVVHTQDMHLAADWIESGRWQLSDRPFADVSAHDGDIRSPLEVFRAATGHP